MVLSSKGLDGNVPAGRKRGHVVQDGGHFGPSKGKPFTYELQLRGKGLLDLIDHSGHASHPVAVLDVHINGARLAHKALATRGIGANVGQGSLGAHVVCIGAHC
jgi:hypothetical protein